MARPRALPAADERSGRRFVRPISLGGVDFASLIYQLLSNDSMKYLQLESIYAVGVHASFTNYSALGGPGSQHDGPFMQLATRRGLRRQVNIDSAHQRCVDEVTLGLNHNLEPIDLGGRNHANVFDIFSGTKIGLNRSVAIKNASRSNAGGESRQKFLIQNRILS